MATVGTVGAQVAPAHAAGMPQPPPMTWRAAEAVEVAVEAAEVAKELAAEAEEEAEEAGPASLSSFPSMAIPEEMGVSEATGAAGATAEREAPEATEAAHWSFGPWAG